MMREGPVVVGVDGSAPSLVATRWAAAEAARRRVPLDVVLAYHWRVPWSAFAPGTELAHTAQQLADAQAEGFGKEASAASYGVDVRVAATLGQPAETLLAAAASAGLLVVGTRGRRTTTGTVLGSVSQQVATHATCPVAVVRGRANPAGPVLVGFDGSGPAGQALELGFQEAAERGCDVSVVRAVDASVGPPAIGAPPLLYDAAEVRRVLFEEAVAQVAAAAAGHPGVAWEFHGVTGDAIGALARRSRQARLVVVGNRGHGGFAGLLLGSVSLRLLHRADCPVLIARG
ncbi:universal stress protein [Dactylosporangium sp. AC04546]|uniref:universal stress protein n=1 Tax=Dactylosporangium sp. AC04546 TaxID=2862460 RepID=UPI001EE04D1B|nr:universal stress protein [Dactylosporangium sp. AC04546]WVK78551.1 universal stress protein [Dactylosporangium sp. AC04546]